MVDSASTIHVNPDDWAALLTHAVQSRKTLFGHHAYLIKANAHAVKASPLKKGLSEEKLSIHEIITISKSQLHLLSISYKKGEISRERFDGLVGKISDLTTQLIDARVAKRNHPLKVLGRQIVYLISAFASLFGLSPFKPLKESDIAFQKEAEADRARFAESSQSAENLMSDRQTQIQLLTQKIPSLIQESLNLREVIQEILTGTIEDNVRSGIDSSINPQFVKDITRGSHFKRRDANRGIQDQEAYPSQLKEEDTRLNEAYQAIKALIEPQDKKAWENILQVLCTQTSINPLFFKLRGDFLMESENCEWKEGERSFQAILKFPGNTLPLIQLDIIRDPSSQTIQKVNVTVEGKLNLVRESMNNGSADIVTSTEVVDAIKGTFGYSVTLDKNDAPVIELTRYELTQ